MPKKKVKEEEQPQKGFNIGSLSQDDQTSFTFVQNRLGELRDSRVLHYGLNLDYLWQDADKNYIPHRLKTTGKKIIAVDDEKGWRGQTVQLGSSDWQSDVSQANPFVKIQTALSLLVDQNPSGVFTPMSKKYEGTSEIIKQLYERSWERAKSKQQLKLFIFNLAKYGWAIARTYPLRITRKVKVITEYDPENPDATQYEEKEVVEYDDVMRENLDPRNCWIDDMARPDNPHSVRDWAWRKVYPLDVFKEKFGKYKNAEFVTPGGNTSETVSATTMPLLGREAKDQTLVEVYFYENVMKDLFMVIANGIPVLIEPLPIADINGAKKLSCWYAYWNLRHAESPYGIGIYEAIRYDQGLLDRIRNMTIDQLTLSIYKMFFYQGTQALTETGDIKIIPGAGKQVLDPKNINWLQVPGPGNEAWQGISLFRQDLDETSGITDPLMGQVTGKTAFEIAQAKESALKRLKTPLDNILEALNSEGYLTVSLMQLLYSIPEVYEISDPELIDAYLNEIQADPELYERDDNGTFIAKVYREFPLNLEKDEKGNLAQANETQFFRVKPKSLNWEGIINIKAQSLLTPSKQVDKALGLEMYNLLIPLFAQPPQLYKKVAENICKLYEKDPKEILPDSWLVEQGMMNAQPLIVPQGQGVPQPGQPAPTLTSSPTAPQTPSTPGQQIIGQVSQGFNV